MLCVLALDRFGDYVSDQVGAAGGTCPPASDARQRIRLIEGCAAVFLSVASGCGPCEGNRSSGPGGSHAGPPGVLSQGTLPPGPAPSGLRYSGTDPLPPPLAGAGSHAAAGSAEGPRGVAGASLFSDLLCSLPAAEHASSCSDTLPCTRRSGMDVLSGGSTSSRLGVSSPLSCFRWLSRH